MKTRFYIVGYVFVLLLTIFIRINQVFNFTNNSTGFFYNSKAVFSSIMLLIIILFFSSLSMYIKRCPVKMPKVTIPLSIASALVGFTLLMNSYQLFKSPNGVNILIIIKMLLSVVAGLFFLIYASKKFLNIHIKRILYVIPLIYWLFTLVESYIKISKMALISENAIMVCSTVFVVLYFLCFSKFANKISSSKKLYKFLLFFSSVASISCETFAIPQLYVIFDGAQKVLHNDVYTILVYLTTGLFIQIFTFSLFSSKNLLKKHKSIEGSDKILPTDFEIKPTDI